MNKAVDDYHRLSDGSALCDYGFHLIVTNPSEEQMETELPSLVDRGVTSVKVSLFLSIYGILPTSAYSLWFKIYMTYPALKLTDAQILDTLHSARRFGVTTMVHCEVRDSRLVDSKLR